MKNLVEPMKRNARIELYFTTKTIPGIYFYGPSRSTIQLSLLRAKRRMCISQSTIIYVQGVNEGQ